MVQLQRGWGLVGNRKRRLELSGTPSLLVFERASKVPDLSFYGQKQRLNSIAHVVTSWQNRRKWSQSWQARFKASRIDRDQTISSLSKLLLRNHPSHDVEIFPLTQKWLEIGRRGL